MVDADGRPLDERKYVYAQAFAMYALAEHHRAFGSAASLRDAINIFLLVDQHAHDALNGGYHEAFTRDWNRLADARLSAQDLDAPKSMNTHLHLLEAHTALYAVWPDPLVRLRLVELIVLFLDTIIADGGRHVVPFFDARWQARSGVASFGHDVESSWLITAAAAAVDDEALLERARCAGLRLATGALEDGVDQQDGGLFLQRGETGVVDTDKEWWPQAEAIVGFMRAYDASGDERFFHAALSVWTFVRDHMRDATGGEWRRRVRRDGAPYLDGERVGPWKCPYHNTRACVEIISDLHGHTR
jgi:mannobiose 2-epimerase